LQANGIFVDGFYNFTGKNDLQMCTNMWGELLHCVKNNASNDFQATFALLE